MEQSILVYTTFVGVISWVAYKLLLQPLMSPLQKLPGLPFRPIFGNLNIVLSGESMESTLNLLKQYGSIYKYHFFGGSPRVAIGGPDLMKYIMVTNIKNYEKAPTPISVITRVLGRGLVFSNGPEHAAHRRLISPSFNNAAVRAMSRVFDSRAAQLCDVWSLEINATAEKDGKYSKISVQKDIPRFTLDVIGKTAFDYEFNSLADPESKAAETFHNILTGRNFNFFLLLREWIPFANRFSSDFKRIRKDLDFIEHTIQQMITNKRQAEDRGDDVTNDILSIMMRARDEDGRGMSDDELNSEVRTLLFAGHETTAVSLTWVLYALSLHPEIQQRLRDEVCAHWPDVEPHVTSERAESMPYLNAVVKETLRLYPAAPMVLRRAVKDDTIAGYRIPAGTRIVLGLGAMMRLPELYPEPEKFNPDRFMQESGPGASQQPNPYLFLPFAIGSRMCIGYKFAILQLKMALCHVIRRFQFEPVPDRKYKRKANITMKPDPELILRMRTL